MKLAIAYMDSTHDVFEVEDEDVLMEAIAQGQGLNIHTKDDGNFASRHYFIPFTAIKKIALNKETP